MTNEINNTEALRRANFIEDAIDVDRRVGGGLTAGCIPVFRRSRTGISI
jgi:hypothetical protein